MMPLSENPQIVSAMGASVQAKDTIGEIGPSKVLCPVSPGSITMDEAWAGCHASMPDIEWSRCNPVDLQQFDAASFGGVRKATK